MNSILLPDWSVVLSWPVPLKCISKFTVCPVSIKITTFKHKSTFNESSSFQKNLFYHFVVCRFNGKAFSVERHSLKKATEQCLTQPLKTKPPLQCVSVWPETSCLSSLWLHFLPYTPRSKSNSAGRLSGKPEREMTHVKCIRPHSTRGKRGASANCISWSSLSRH